MYFNYKDDLLTMGNDAIERRIFFKENVPRKTTLFNKKTGFEWESGKDDIIAINGIDLKGNELSISDNSVIFKGNDYTLVWEFVIDETLPIIQSRIGIKGKKRKLQNNQDAVDANGVEGVTTLNLENDYVEMVGCQSNHMEMDVIELFDRTDCTNSLVQQKTIPIHNGWCNFKEDGNIFVVREKLSRQECLVIREAPCASTQYMRGDADFFCWLRDKLHVCGSGINVEELSEDEYMYSYITILGVCAPGESNDLFRDYYELKYKMKPSYLMSNTWGGGNRDARICEDFMMLEISKAKELGVEIVQLDDGWQKGLTANSTVKSGAWGKYRKEEPDFWEINKDRFPNGFEKILEHAKNCGVELGLWFSPDGEDDYAMYEDDAKTVYDMYKKYGIKYFKIDGVILENRTAEINFGKMFELVNEWSNGEIIFNMDITHGKRFGYLLHHEIGDVFVENRGIYSGTYYPDKTLSSLWQISQYFPSSRFQIEIVNNKQASEKYNDILAPKNYDVEYIFAVGMLANPLMWMEMQFLTDEDTKKLAEMIKIYKKYRNDFKRVKPILDCPDGFSLTGFSIEGKENNYVLLFREMTDECDFDITIKEVIATNDEKCKPGKARLNKKGSFVFATV